MDNGVTGNLGSMDSPIFGIKIVHSTKFIHYAKYKISISPSDSANRILPNKSSKLQINLTMLKLRPMCDADFWAYFAVSFI